MANAVMHQGSSNPLLGHVEMYCLFDGKIVSAMFGTEQFEEVTEGERAVEGHAGKIRAAYVVANQHQLIQSIVLFVLPLDSQGYCIDGWRLPLERLSDTAGRGPNLGGGRIRLACHSQCSISWHADSLWDPTTSHFSAIKKSMHDYILKTYGEVLPEVASDGAGQGGENSIDVLRRELRNESATYRNQLQVLQQEVERQRLLNERLLDRGELQPVSNEPVKDKVDLQVLRRQNEQLTMKVRELQVSNERLRSSEPDNQEISLAGSDNLIEKMSQQEIMSVVFHAGVGHINLTPHQIQDYLDDPIAYAAHHVSLSKIQYLNWLQHEKKPKCSVCDAVIPIIADPTIFDPEIDVYCEQHKPT